MRAVVLLAITGACSFSSNVAGDGGIVDTADAAIDAPKPDGAPGSGRKKRITILDAQVFADLSAFPVWFVLDDATGLGANATTSGDDIYFTLPDGTPLEWERVAWTKATGHLAAWIKVDLTDAAPTLIDLRYGDPGPAHLPDAAMAFTNGFAAVWHLDDTLSGTTVIRDARNTVNGTAVNGPVPIPGGKLHRAIDFDGNNDEITFANPLLGNASHTVSAWVAIANPTGGFSSVMTVGNAMDHQSRWFHTKFTGLAYGFYGDDVQTTVDVHNSQFTLLHWVYDAGAQTTSLYRDGVQVGTTVDVNGNVNTAAGTGHLGTAPSAWGPGGMTPCPINGIVDEVRVSTVVRPLGWIRTEHANQNNPAGFYTVGPEQPAP